MMNNNYDISVIICCYNPDIQKLKNTINSIYQQKNIKFEVIISDDGSKNEYKDELDEWLKKKEYTDFYLNFLPHNNGTIKNIIDAIEHSRSDYVKVISPGDYFFDEYSLEKYINEFKEKNADVLFSRAVFYCDDCILPSKFPANPTVFNNKALLRKVVLFHNYILGATIAAKKSVELQYLNEIKDKMKYLEDVPLTFMSLLDGKNVYAISDNLIWYEFGYGISTNSNRSKILVADYNAFFEYLKEKYPKNNIVNKSIKIYSLKKYSRFVRIVKKMFLTPVFIKDLFEKIFNKNKKKNSHISIDKLKKIIGE